MRTQSRIRFRVLLVDEFQDTPPLLAELLLLLAGTERATLRPSALFIVGDPKQSIYRFRRADVGAYRRISEQLGAAGATAVTLQTSSRSVPAIQHFVNAAFRDDMNGDRLALQADYVSLLSSRPDHVGQPAVVALPVSRPYRRREVTQSALASSQPRAIGQFVKWLLSSDCTWTVGARTDAGKETRRRIVPSDSCLLFRRFLHFGSDVTRDRGCHSHARCVGGAGRRRRTVSKGLGPPAEPRALSASRAAPVATTDQQPDASTMRRDDLISKDANPDDVAADRARYEDWKRRRSAVQEQGSAPSMVVTTPTQLKDLPDPESRIPDPGSRIPAWPSKMQP